MTRPYWCRIPDQDGEEWTEVKDAHYPEMAARMYAEDQDANSAMELFQDNAEVTIFVKNAEGVEWKFKGSREHVPSYALDEIDPKPEPESDIPI